MPGGWALPIRLGRKHAQMALATLMVGVAVTALRAVTLLPAAGPVSRQMVHHIVLMNLVAPAVAWVIARRTTATTHGALLWAATVLQIVVIWAIHVPAGFHAHATPSLHHFALIALMMASALLFWRAIATMSGDVRWQSILALLVTGKLVCLIGVILTFAPRPLYAAAAADSATALADQQLAGLLMLAACPLTYIAAAVVISIGWIGALGASHVAISKRDQLQLDPSSP